MRRRINVDLQPTSVSDRPTRGSVGRVTNFGEQKRIGAQLVPRSVPSTHLRIVRRGWHATVCTRHRCNRHRSAPGLKKEKKTTHSRRPCSFAVASSPNR